MHRIVVLVGYYKPAIYSDSMLKKLATAPPTEEWLKSQPRPQFPGLVPGQAYGGMIPSYGLGSWLRDNSKTLLGGATAVAGGALMATGFGAPLGVGLMASGAQQMVGGIQENRQLKQSEQAQESAIKAQGIANKQMNSQMVGQNQNMMDYY